MIDIWKVRELIENFRASKWKGVQYIKNGGRKLGGISTNDLDSEGKLKPNYKRDRELKRKKRNAPKSCGWVD